MKSTAAFEHEATVGIAAVHHGHLLAPLAGFEDLRAGVRLDEAAPEELVARYADGLAGEILGAQFRAARSSVWGPLAAGPRRA